MLASMVTHRHSRMTREAARQPMGTNLPLSLYGLSLELVLAGRRAYGLLLRGSREHVPSVTLANVWFGAALRLGHRVERVLD